MSRYSLCVFFLSLFLFLQATTSEENDVRDSLIKFLKEVSFTNSNDEPVSVFGWNTSSDPCFPIPWIGIECDAKSNFVKKVVLDGKGLSGSIDTSLLCAVPSMTVLSFQHNSFSGVIGEDIGNCKQMTHLLLSGNQFSGVLPDSLSWLNNLKKLEIANNSFSGKLPNLARITGLVSFLADNNQFTGEIPNFDFSNLALFNVSNNNFTGPVPDLHQFGLDSVSGNLGLCGGPMPNACPPSPSQKKHKSHSLEHTLMYSGYFLIGALVVLFILFKLFAKKKPESTTVDAEIAKGGHTDTSTSKPSAVLSEYKMSASKAAEYSVSGDNSAMMSQSMVVLSSPVVKGLKFEDLLKAPAELLGRGIHGSVYKITLEDGMPLVVKRIKDWAISGDDFKRRMQKIDQKKHPNVLPAVAFYSSKQEKLVVYKYQQNGSLFKILSGTHNGETFDWECRLHAAAKMAEAMAYMHSETQADGIGHGNLKSTNVLLNLNMDAVISEYGLMIAENKNKDSATENVFKADVYGLGVILLELLTGKLVDTKGMDLAKWVHSVVSEEWTVEVFDKNLVREGASEERLVNVLQVALKCTNPNPEARPTMNEVSSMINTIKEEEEASMASEVW